MRMWLSSMGRSDFGVVENGASGVLIGLYCCRLLGDGHDHWWFVMQIYAFVTREELDDLPEEPRAAFLDFVTLATRRLHEQRSQLNLEIEVDHDEWVAICHNFAVIVVGVATEYEVYDVAGLHVPPASNFSELSFRQFMSELNRVTAQLAIWRASETRRDAVRLDDKERDRIRSHVSALREQVHESRLADKKKRELLSKLDEIEAALARRRVSMTAVALVLMAVLAVPGDLFSSANVVNQLVVKVLATLGEAKVADDERRELLRPAPVQAIAPPARKSQDEHDVDPDDIPF